MMLRYTPIMTLILAISCGGSPADLAPIDPEGKAELTEPPACSAKDYSEWPLHQDSEAYQAFSKLAGEEKMGTLYGGRESQPMVWLYQNSRLGRVWLRDGFKAVKITAAEQLHCGINQQAYGNQAFTLARTGSGAVEGLYSIEQDGERFAFEYRIEGEGWGWRLVIDRRPSEPREMGQKISELDWLIPDRLDDHLDPDYSALEAYQEEIDIFETEQRMKVFYPQYVAQTRGVEYQRSEAFRRIKVPEGKLRAEHYGDIPSFFGDALNKATWGHDPSDPGNSLHIYALVSKGLIYAYEFEMRIGNTQGARNFITVFDLGLVRTLGEFDWAE